MNYKNQTRITLKAVKYYAGLSEETNAYSAKVYFDGQLVGTASNRGNGGCDDYWPAEKSGAKNQAMQEFINALPVIDVDTSGGSCSQLMPDLDMVCGHLLAQHLIEKDYRRAIKNRVLFVESGELRQTRVNISPTVLASWAGQLAKRDGVTHVFSRTSNPEDLAQFARLAVQS